MKKIKVLHFPLANSYSGVTQYVLQNWKWINKNRFQFDFATMCKSKLHFEDEVIAQGCKVFHISCYAEDNEKQFADEVQRILAEGYDVVHLHTSYWKSFQVEELAKEVGIPKVIIHAHNSCVLNPDPQNEAFARHKRCVEALSESMATDFWACSSLAADWLYGNSIPKGRIVIQKNAIDVDRYRYQEETSRKVRKELGWKNNYIIGHVGRFVYQKNHGFLFRVFQKVHEQNSDVKLLLVGTGAEQEQIRKQIRDWGLEDSVVILERRNDVNELMQAMDCFALPSRFEGLPIVLVEAQAAGCECLAAETITREAILTDNCRRMPLEERKWVKELIRLSGTEKIRHTENADVVREKGFDLKDQIRIIEKGYLQGI